MKWTWADKIKPVAVEGVLQAFSEAQAARDLEIGKKIDALLAEGVKLEELSIQVSDDDRSRSTLICRGLPVFSARVTIGVIDEHR